VSRAPTIAQPTDGLTGALPAPPSAVELAGLGRFAGALPVRWTASRRRRRLLFLALAAPGFWAVFATPAHQSFRLLGLGLLHFAAAVLFRRLSEPVFARAEAAALWPPPPLRRPVPDSRSSHAKEI
jgi:hypothetical protein